MSIPRFPNGLFPEFCQFRMEKKRLALEIKNLSDSPYSLIHIRFSDEISNNSETNLTWHLHVQGNNKNIRTRDKTCLKLKPKVLEYLRTYNLFYLINEPRFKFGIFD